MGGTVQVLKQNESDNDEWVLIDPVRDPPSVMRLKEDVEANNNDYSDNFSYPEEDRTQAIDKSEITPLHRKVATGLLGFMSMFYIKIIKEMAYLEYPDLNY